MLNVRLVRKLSPGLRKQWGRRIIKLRPARPTLVHLDSFIEEAVEAEEYAQLSYATPVDQIMPPRPANGRNRVSKVKPTRPPTIFKVSSDVTNEIAEGSLDHGTKTCCFM